MVQFRRIGMSVATGAVLMLWAASPAIAACPSLPDGPESANVTNGVDRALCLQEELAAETRRLQQTKEFQIMLQNLQQDQMEWQRRMLPPARVF